MAGSICIDEGSSRGACVAVALRSSGVIFAHPTLLITDDLQACGVVFM